MAKGFNTQKIYSMMRLGATFLPAAVIAMGPGTPEYKLMHGVKAYFGWNMWTKTFSFSNLLEGWGPRIGAEIGTRVIPKIGSMIRGLMKGFGG